MRLHGKAALVTGAGSGIGRAIALRFALEGASLSLADVDEQGGEETCELIRSRGPARVSFYRIDISRRGEVQEWVERAAREMGGVDILINNAAAFVFGTVEETEEDDWDQVLAVNVKGAAWCARYVAPHMRRRGGGAIVNIGSISSFIAQPAFVPYNTSKGAVLQLTRCLAYDLAKDGIRVNCVCPGTIDTPAVDRLAELQGLSREQLHEESKQLHLLNRLGRPEEVASAVLFLASDEASFITAASLMVDGGYTAH